MRRAVDDNHGNCPERAARCTPNTPGPHMFQHPTNLTPTWCILCGRAPAVLCDAHPGRHAWAKDCDRPRDADSGAQRDEKGAHRE